MSRDDAREKALENAREKLSEPIERDQSLIKAVKLLGDLRNRDDDVFERFRDWYSLHFPELVEEIQDDEQLLKVLSEGVERDSLDAFREMAGESTGSEMVEDDQEILETVIDFLQQENQIETKLESYVKRVAKEEMPNLSVLLGPVLAAKILALSGSLEDLAKSPASTIQMLGAEKALFRYMKGEGTPPKHGILFEHELVSGLPDSERGKMARFIANKSAMAARLDLYSEKEKGEELRQEARKKFKELEN